MSAILSADSLNDFISPGIACIKPVETLPKTTEASQSSDSANANSYEVALGEEKKAAEQADVKPVSAAEAAQISLTDCLACSGCVTSAEAVLVSLQSHAEVLKVLDESPALEFPVQAQNGWGERRDSGRLSEMDTRVEHGRQSGLLNQGEDVMAIDDIATQSSLNATISRPKLFVATVSPQARASLAATFNVSQRRAGYMIEQLLCGPHGLKAGGRHGSCFALVVDSNVFREIALKAAFDELQNTFQHNSSDSDDLLTPNRPVLASACPGWICYVEKTHPHILPYLSRVKSPQAIAGTFIKSILSHRYGLSPSDIWHMALMPCFDKKLEASRAEFTSASWEGQAEKADTVREVDCVITARELLQLASARHVHFGDLPRRPLQPLRKKRFLKRRKEDDVQEEPPSTFQDALIDDFITKNSYRPHQISAQSREAGPSGGYLWHILKQTQAAHPGSSIKTQRGRNVDVMEYAVVHDDKVVLRAARCYGFRNIQNLVRRLRPAKQSMRMMGKGTAGTGTGGRRGQGAGPGGGMEDYAYVEVMACPGGCTNGGGQIRMDDLIKPEGLLASGNDIPGAIAATDTLVSGQRSQKEWLTRVDEAYFSAESTSNSDNDSEINDSSSIKGQDNIEGNGLMNGALNGTTGSKCNDQLDAHIVNSYNHNDSDHTNGSILDNQNYDRDNDVDSNSYSNYLDKVINRWSGVTDIDRNILLYTSYHYVESDVGKDKDKGGMQQVAGLASAAGGGW